MTEIHTYADLLTASAVRAQSQLVTEHVDTGGGLFWLDPEALAGCAQFVAKTTLDRYPSLDIPYHSRWRHFDAPGSVLLSKLQSHLDSLNNLERARVGFDLVIPSVLLDAGAGADWSYLAQGCSDPVRRSEGLGLASLAMFLSGSFSSLREPHSDSVGLAELSVQQLLDGFGVTDANPLLAVKGRTEVLNALGAAIAARPNVFPNGRVGDLVDYLLAMGPLTANNLLETLLDVLAPIWPPRLERDGLRLGDSWVYEPLGSGPNGIVPFHKLSQWMTYSLVETLGKNGYAVAGVDELTGLPEYRNGGLLYETGVIGLHDPGHAGSHYLPESQLIVEWRALTITQIDAVAELVREILGKPGLGLAEILEGGTWAAGRRLAFQRDPSGRPPLKLESDGTVF
jgi:hypothetical protein